MWKLPEGMEQWKKELEEWLNHGIEFINQIPPTQLYIACTVLLLTTALLLLRESHLRNRFRFSKLCFHWSLGIYNFIWILRLRTPWIKYYSFVAFLFFFFLVTCLYNGFLILFKRGEIKWIGSHILDFNLLNGLFYLAVQVFRRKKSTTIVLAGLSGSGKTVLFYQVSAVDSFFLSATCGKSDNGARCRCLNYSLLFVFSHEWAP